MQGMWQSVRTIFRHVWPNVTSATYAVSLQYLTDSVLAVRNKYLSLLLLSVFGQQLLHSTRSYCMLIQSQSRETKRLQRQTVIRFPSHATKCVGKCLYWKITVVVQGCATVIVTCHLCVGNDTNREYYLQMAG